MFIRNPHTKIMLPIDLYTILLLLLLFVELHSDILVQKAKYVYWYKKDSTNYQDLQAVIYKYLLN